MCLHVGTFPPCVCVSPIKVQFQSIWVQGGQDITYSVATEYLQDARFNHNALGMANRASQKANMQTHTRALQRFPLPCDKDPLGVFHIGKSGRHSAETWVSKSQSAKTRGRPLRKERGIGTTSLCQANSISWFRQRVGGSLLGKGEGQQ